MKKTIIAFFGGSIFFFGIFVGIIIENIRQSEQKIFDFSFINIPEKNVPVLLLEKIENGVLYGKIMPHTQKISENNQIRIIVKKSSQKQQEVKILSTGNFYLNITDILPMLKKIPAPYGKKFVASKRGKKFYALDNPKAFLISPSNRIFFDNKEEAKNKGFKEY